LGTPEGTPDPLEKYRWPILAACFGALVIGGFWVVTKNQPAQPAKSAVAPPLIPAVYAAPAAASSAPTLLLQAMKEELFQLEMDRQQGKLSEAEYTSAKAALDQTLARAIARSKQVANS
jgi:hypothetical protein